MRLTTIMPQNNKTKKTIFEGSLSRRAFLICLVFLILPLFLHTFLLYKKEFQDEERMIRADLRAIGAQTAQRMTDIIQADWQLLEMRANWLELHTVPITPETPSQFVDIDREKDAIVVGIATSDTIGIAILHPITALLALPEPASFPLELTLDSLPQDRWQETFPLPGNLTLTIGTSSEQITDLQKTNLIFRITSFLFIVGILGGACVYFLLRMAYRPLNALRLTMERVASGAIHSRYTPHRLGFELNAIGEGFNDTLNSVLRHQAEAEIAKIAREKLAQELHLGHVIQEGLLPREFPTNLHLDIGTGYLPAKEVGGDFYDVFPLHSGKCLIVIADLAGKGISACLFSLGLRSSLRALASTTESLSQIVAKANDLFLLDAKETGQFATFWIGLLESQKLEYISLGHLPVLLKRQGQLLELSTHHPAMGLMPLPGLIPNHQVLESGDELLLYSDGATEAHDSTQELYGMGRLKTSFLRCQGMNAQESSNQILQDIQRFSQGTDQHDDLTLLVVRLHPTH